MKVEERFWTKVNKDGPIPEYRPDLGPCWLWAAGKNLRGYGRFSLSGRAQSSHRVAYELTVGPIPYGLEIDHLCRDIGCVNPAHLEPVTHLENVRRGEAHLVSGRVRGTKTHCPKGHPYDEDNTYRWRGRRLCRICNRICQVRLYKERKSHGRP